MKRILVQAALFVAAIVVANLIVDLARPSLNWSGSGLAQLATAIGMAAFYISLMVLDRIWPKFVNRPDERG